jgi:hypothetical protein
MARLLLMTAGTISLLTGIAGIFVPVLPSTPFFLLTAGLYLKSSPVLHNWLITNKLTSTYLNGKTKLINVRTLILALSVMWISILAAAIFAVSETWIRMLLIAAGFAGTAIKLLLFMKNKNPINKNKHERHERKKY